MYTTNICKKVIRWPLRRLFKIGHLSVYFCFGKIVQASSKLGFWP